MKKTKFKKIFNIWRLIIQISFTTRGLWHVKSSRIEKHNILFGIHIVQHEGDALFNILMGPVAIAIGIV